MSLVLRADEAPAGSRVEHWRDRICDVIGPHDVRAPDGVDPHDRLTIAGRDLGPLGAGR